jgi:hypothetical protein
MFHHLKLPVHDLKLHSPRYILLLVLVTFLWDLFLFPPAVCFLGCLVAGGVCLEY